MKSKKKVSKKKTVSAAKAPVTKARAVSTSAGTPSTPFQWLLAIYALFFLAHVAVMSLVSSFFPEQIVLGTHLLSPLMGLGYSMAVFTLLTVAAMPVIEGLSKATNMKLKDMHWMVIYFFVNFFSIWIVARFAEMLGMGLSSWRVAAALAVVMDVVQGMIIMNLPKDMN